MGNTQDEIRYQLFLVKGQQEAYKRMETEPAIGSVMLDKMMALDLELIEKWLMWMLAFAQFFDRGFKDKNGEYRKPGFWKYAAIITALLRLGLQLIGLKKIK